MDNKIYICLLGMSIAVPMATYGAAVQPEKTIVVQTIDKQEVEIPERIAKLSRTLKNWIKDLPKNEKREFSENSGITGAKFKTVIDLLQVADKFKDKPLKERIQTIGDEITKKFVQVPMDQWVNLVNDINFLDIEILEAPLADSMIKYVCKHYSLNTDLAVVGEGIGLLNDVRSLEILEASDIDRMMKSLNEMYNKEKDKIKTIIMDLNVPAAFKGLMAKYWYLNHGANKNFIEISEKVIEATESGTKRAKVEKEIPINYGFSVDELLAYNKLPKVVIGDLQLNLDHLHINDLNGLNKVPDIGIVMMLNLSFNQIKKLNPGDLSSCSYAGWIFLGNNQIQEVHSNVFNNPNTRLVSLDLSENQIKEVHSDDFNSLKDLRTLYLTNNPIDIKTKNALQAGLRKIHPDIEIKF